jgi:group I intron endonuclease
MTLTASGIYQIVNSTNGKQYIGSAVNLPARFSCHLHGLRHGNHFNSYLQNAWDKYGEDVFVFKVLLYCRKEDLIFYEQRALDVYNALYNLCPSAGNTLGRAFSEEAKMKMSEAHKGYKASEETRRKLSEVHKGRPAHNKGVSPSEETRAKLSEVRKGKSTWIKGKHHSEETKRKISEALMGNTNSLGFQHSDETKAKLSAIRKGRPKSDEWKKKISESKKGSKNPQYGKPVSEETKKKISETLRKKRQLG